MSWALALVVIGIHISKFCISGAFIDKFVLAGKPDELLEQPVRRQHVEKVSVSLFMSGLSTFKPLCLFFPPQVLSTYSSHH